MEQITAGWRFVQPDGFSPDGEPYVDIKPTSGLSLFETIEQSDYDDDQVYILGRSEHCFALLNVYPYTPGHVMVLPKRAVVDLLSLHDHEYADLWSLVRQSTKAVKEAFQPHGLNVGVNEGTAGGGSYPEHLHVHVVPRWDTDCNFMTSIAQTRVLPMTLKDSWQRLRDVW